MGTLSEEELAQELEAAKDAAYVEGYNQALVHCAIGSFIVLILAMIFF